MPEAKAAEATGAEKKEATAPSEEKKGGKIAAKVEEALTLRLEALGRGLWDATGNNIWNIVKDTFSAVRETLGGLVAEPIKGVGEGLKELTELHPFRAILKIVKGVRDGVKKAVGGVVNLGIWTPLKAVGRTGEGLLRAALSPLGDLSKA